MSEIQVSICCLVYNQEKYLRKCLDGLLMQKTNFAFEILIHDDASTDSSADIIREYEKKYPNIIKPIYQTENQFSKGIKISLVHQFPRSQGKYIAFCEGDDYWCDENKLQLQYDEMEKNENAVFCAHDVGTVSEDGVLLEDTFPKKKIEKMISSQRMLSVMEENNMYPFQTSSYFVVAKYLKNLYRNMPKFMQVSNVGDVPLMLYLLTKGDVIYINKKMSYYRVGSVQGWNTLFRDSNSKRILQIKNGIASYCLYDVYTEGEYTDTIKSIILQDWFNLLLLVRDYRQINNKIFRKYYKNMPLKNRVYLKLCGLCPLFEKVYAAYKKK